MAHSTTVALLIHLPVKRQSRLSLNLAQVMEPSLCSNPEEALCKWIDTTKTLIPTS